MYISDCLYIEIGISNIAQQWGHYANRVHTISVTFGRRSYWRFSRLIDGDPWSDRWDQRHPIAYFAPGQQRSITPTGFDLSRRSLACRAPLDRDERSSAAANCFYQPATIGLGRRFGRIWICLGQWLHKWPRGMRHIASLRSLDCCDIDLHEHWLCRRSAAPSRFWGLMP